MDIQDVARRVLHQRLERYTDAGPSLQPAGTARFRIDALRIRVGYVTVVPGMASEMVRMVMRYAHSRRLQVQWSVVPARRSEEGITAALQEARFDLVENLLLMAHQGPLSVRRNLAVSVVPVTTWQQMWQYEYGSRQSFYDDPLPSDALVGQRATDRWHELTRGWCRYYVALVNGRQVGGGYISRYEDVPTIMGIYTLAAARRQGVATAILARIIADIEGAQNALCCLYVERGNPAERLYRSLGFVPIFDTQTYLHNAP
jgi:GNAT superfamily N-acetyltransferase